MGQIIVTSSQLRAAADELRNLNNQFSTQVGKLEASENMLNSQWEGEANDAFHKAFASDKEQMNNFYTLINQYCEMLENIAIKYDEAESRNVDTATTRVY